MASKHQTKLIKEYEAKGYFVINLIKTNKPGIADLLCLKVGEVPLFIESKEVKDTVKPLQWFMQSMLSRYGFISIISKAKK